jgi:hypothetical protein
MLLSSFDNNIYNVKLHYDCSINNTIKINISKQVIDINNNIDIFYKFFFINSNEYTLNKQKILNNNNTKILDIDKKLQNFLNNNKSIIFHKNPLTDLIVNYLLMYDDELYFNCFNLKKIKKILLLFLFYLNEEDLQ